MRWSATAPLRLFLKQTLSACPPAQRFSFTFDFYPHMKAEMGPKMGTEKEQNSFLSFALNEVFLPSPRPHIYQCTLHLLVRELDILQPTMERIFKNLRETSAVRYEGSTKSLFKII